MPLPIYRLRRWLAVIAVLFIAVVAGTYFYARLRLRNVLREVPNKIGIDIKQTANGFQFSKSDGKRTLFTVQAGKLKQFKLDGSAELHNVSIVLYGRDSSRFDQIYGDDFSYDKKSGNVTGSRRGADRSGSQSHRPDRTRPEHAQRTQESHPPQRPETWSSTRNSGDATTDARVDFQHAAGQRLGCGRAVFRKDQRAHAGLAGSCDDGRAGCREPFRYPRQNHARSA